MKHMYPTVILTGLLTLALGLSACSSLGSDSSGSSGAAGNAGFSEGPGSSGGRSLDTSMPPGSASTGAGTGTTLDPSAQTGQTLDHSGAMGASGASGATGSSDAQAQGSQRSGMPTAANATPNGTVVSIEPLASNERSGSGSGSGSAGSSASGASGSGGTGQAYRVTVRMDNGSIQVITHAGTPALRSGDRVNLGSGVISR